MDTIPNQVQYQTLERMVIAVEKVKARLQKSAAALEAAGVPYAIIGGNAVGSWVESVDPSAVRTTVDVDILLNRQDFEAAKLALESVGFHYANVLGVDVFLDDMQSNPRDAVHILWSGEKVKESYAATTPQLSESQILGNRRVVSLEALVRMKLTSYRRKDQVHVQDMIGVGLVNDSWLTKYPEPLQGRLKELLDDPEG
jgi:hypothetical protein